MTQEAASEVKVRKAEPLYQKHKKIYPRIAHGIFANLRKIAMWTLLAIYYLTPWMRWDGNQAVLLDLPHRQFHIFSLTLWPQDLLYLTFLLAIAAFALFFFTALAGRLWCGYACPQTVWTESFLLIEQWLEGDRQKQIKLDKAPWDARKIRIKTTKHILWALFALWTGFTFVGYFTPIHDLWARAPFGWSAWETFWVFFYSFATWGFAGFMREQVCLHMCPYARFQSAMFDRDTLVVSYHAERGEPRGRRKKGVEPASIGLGDCVDCTMCVQVCPTGIDIRNGLQYECIGCAACIDACDEIMEKVGYEKGLIRYTTENSMEGKQTHILRPRIIVYALILLTMMSALVYSVSTRIPLQLDVIRDRNMLYRETDEGMIQNVYTLKVMNMDDKAHNFVARAEGIPGLKLVADKNKIAVKTGEVAEWVVRLEADPDKVDKRSVDIRFILEAEDDNNLRSVEEGRFVGPIPEL